MSYAFAMMARPQAEAIAQWRYTGPYALYNPGDAEITEYVIHLLQPHHHYYAIFEGVMLVGFCCFGEDAQVPGGDYTLPNTLDIGLGLHPDLTGQGRGREFLRAILDFGTEQYNAEHFRATVAVFNQRSQKTFAQAGFQPVQRFVSSYDHITEFVVLVRNAMQS
jgi:RimJ/RimL family protein N-acetyltransferase